MPFYDFFCKECKILVEDEFFKIADEKDVKCEECDGQMEQVILKAPGLRDTRGVGQKWTNDGYQFVDDSDGARTTRIVNNKWVKGKQVITEDIHKDFDPVDPILKIKQKQIEKGDTRFIKGHKDEIKPNNPAFTDSEGKSSQDSQFASLIGDYKKLTKSIFDKVNKTKKTGI